MIADQYIQQPFDNNKNQLKLTKNVSVAYQEYNKYPVDNTYDNKNSA